MKKKIILILLISFMFMGIVSAANLWGSYKGNSIIRITYEGVPVKVSSAPAMIYSGQGFIPSYLLKSVGVKYTWDAKTQTIDFKKQVAPDPVIQTKFFSVKDIAKEMKKLDVKGVEFLASEDSAIITYYYKYEIEHLDARIDRLNEIFMNSIRTDATSTRILYPDGTEFMVSTQALRDFYSGKITQDELSKAYKLTQSNKVNSNSSNVSSNNNTSDFNTKPNNDTKNTTCDNLRNQYNSEKSNTNFGVRPFPDKPNYYEKMFEQTWADKFAANGC